MPAPTAEIEIGDPVVVQQSRSPMAPGDTIASSISSPDGATKVFVSYTSPVSLSGTANPIDDLLDQYVDWLLGSMIRMFQFFDGSSEFWKWLQGMGFGWMWPWFMLFAQFGERFIAFSVAQSASYQLGLLGDGWAPSAAYVGYRINQFDAGRPGATAPCYWNAIYSKDVCRPTSQYALLCGSVMYEDGPTLSDGGGTDWCWQVGELWRTDDDGLTWTPLGSLNGIGDFRAGDYTSMDVDGQGNIIVTCTVDHYIPFDYIYEEYTRKKSYYKRIWKYTAATGTWTGVADSAIPGSNRVHDFHAMSHVGNGVWIASGYYPSNYPYGGFYQGWVWRSGDGGATWTANTYVDTTYYPRIEGFVRALDGAILAYGTPGPYMPGSEGGVWRSTDGGISWSRIATGSFTKVCIVRSGKLFALASGSLYTSTDHGFTWTGIEGYVTGDMWGLEVNRSGDIVVSAPTYISVSQDGGETFSRCTIGSGYAVKCPQLSSGGVVIGIPTTYNNYNGSQPSRQSYMPVRIDLADQP